MNVRIFNDLVKKCALKAGFLFVVILVIGGQSFLIADDTIVLADINNNTDDYEIQLTPIINNPSLWLKKGRYQFRSGTNISKGKVMYLAIKNPIDKHLLANFEIIPDGQEKNYSTPEVNIKVKSKPIGEQKNAAYLYTITVDKNLKKEIDVAEKTVDKNVVEKNKNDSQKPIDDSFSPTLRYDYENEVLALKTKYLSGVDLDNLTDKQLEDLARKMHTERRNIGIKFKAATPEYFRKDIFKRNLEKYGDEYGPTIDYLRTVQGKSWKEIILSSSKPGGGDLWYITWPSYYAGAVKHKFSNFVDWLKGNNKDKSEL